MVAVSQPVILESLAVVLPHQTVTGYMQLISRIMTQKAGISRLRPNSNFGGPFNFLLARAPITQRALANIS